MGSVRFAVSLQFCPELYPKKGEKSHLNVVDGNPHSVYFDPKNPEPGITKLIFQNVRDEGVEKFLQEHLRPLIADCLKIVIRPQDLVPVPPEKKWWET